MTGGAENDTFEGGAGNDTFNIDSGTDTIKVDLFFVQLLFDQQPLQST
mgnify:CR=1 FL=1